MIPKIIHFCWLSDDPYPQEIQRCLDSWKKILPDYEIWKWDRKRFDINSVPWTKEAFESKKYAFAADYIRLYALYNYGGIYLDSDVLMYKSFNPLLNLPYFIGTDMIGYFEPAIIGAEKGISFIGDVLDYYNGKHFVNNNGVLATDVPLPGIFYNVLKNAYSFKKVSIGETYEDDGKIMRVFSHKEFNGRNSVKIQQYKESFCSHNFVGSWYKPRKGIRGYLRKVLPTFIVRSILFFSERINSKKFIYRINVDKK